MGSRLFSQRSVDHPRRQGRALLRRPAEGQGGGHQPHVHALQRQLPAGDGAHGPGAEAARRPRGKGPPLLFHHHRTRPRPARGPQGLCGALSRPARVALPHRQDGGHQAHRGQARAVLAHRQGKQGWPSPDADGGQRADGRVDAQLRGGQPTLPGGDDGQLSRRLQEGEAYREELRRSPLPGLQQERIPLQEPLLCLPHHRPRRRHRARPGRRDRAARSRLGGTLHLGARQGAGRRRQDRDRALREVQERAHARPQLERRGCYGVALAHREDRGDRPKGDRVTAAIR
jgi:hypothetical protein